MRYDLVVLQTGMRAGVVRARLEELPVDADPVVLVRRQGVSEWSYHRVGLRRLRARLEGEPEDRRIGELLDLDAGNEVPVLELADLDDAPPYGLVAMGRTILGFSEGPIAMASSEPRRGGPVATAPPPVAAPAPPPPPATPPTGPSPSPAGPSPRPARPPASAPPPPAAPPRPATAGSAPTASPPRPDTATPGPPEAPAFTAHPHIDAPVTVGPDERFTVVVDLRREAARHTAGDLVLIDTLTPDDEATDQVTVHVLVTGPFAVADGSHNAGELRVDRRTLAGEPFRVDLVPGDPPDSYDPQVGVWTARLTASFHYDGALVGEAHREIRVNQMRTRSAERESERHPPATDDPVLAAPSDAPPDLTITLRREGNAATSTLRVELTSPHLPAPTDAGTVELGTDVRAFAAQVIKDVDKTIADRVSDETLASVGHLLRDRIPDVAVTILEHVWKVVCGPDVPPAERRVPDVLLLTDDWAVPWELLRIELDPDRPPFLGAQVNLGRWPLEHLDRLTAQPLGLARMGVMVGYYQDARGVAPLARAEAEGAAIAETYEARVVGADSAAFDQLLAGAFDDDGFSFEGLHFAGHGQSDPGEGTYLMYSNGASMSVLPFRSARIAQERDAFLFVNACQVGTADQMLGGYAGLAGLSIAGGFRGFIAPLWSVADDVAQSISLGLYAASARGEPVAAYLREVRGRFRQTPEAAAHTTYLAYAFYGHPRLRLGGPRLRERPA